jgi:hypothetical protein
MRGIFAGLLIALLGVSPVAMAKDGESEGVNLPDGSELIFTPGMQVRFEVSAPGYMTKIISYDIRKRKNNIEISLDKLQVDEEMIEEPMIQFGRDKPRDDAGAGPAN